MAIAQSLLGELEAAIASHSVERRINALRRVTDLFLNDSTRLTEKQVEVFDDVLVHLVERIESKALVELSNTLAPVDNAPLEVIRRLARNDDVAVAGPVLTHSNRLSDSDLLDVAKTKDQGHLLAISGRASLPESLTDVLIDRGNAQVHYALAANSGALFSHTGFALLASKAESDETLIEKLGLRPDIPLQILRKLLERASEIVRGRLLKSASPQNRDRVASVLATISNEFTIGPAAPFDYARADGLVFELNRKGKLNEACLVQFINDRKSEEVVAALALFCGVKSALIEQLVRHASPDGLITACKAAKLHWPTLELLLLGRAANHRMGPEELRAAKDSFIELSQATAQRAIRFMQTSEVSKKTA